MIPFEEDLEKWVWMALAGVIVGVAAVLIFWFPLERKAERMEDVAFKLRKQPQESFKLDEGMKELVGLLEEGRKGGEISPLPRDPFLSVGEVKWLKFVEEVSLNPPPLQGIVEKEGTRYALLKGKLLREGEEIEGFRIERIDPEMVHLTKEGKSVTVKMPRPGGLP
jgi:hypothetical protein